MCVLGLDDWMVVIDVGLIVLVGSILKHVQIFPFILNLNYIFNSTVSVKLPKFL